MTEHAGDVLPAFVKPVSGGGWRIFIKAQPGAKKSEIMEVSEGRLRVRVAAPAVENKANKVLLDFIAKKLNIRLSKLSLENGESSREKRLFVASDAEPDWAALASEK